MWNNFGKEPKSFWTENFQWPDFSGYLVNRWFISPKIFSPKFITIRLMVNKKYRGVNNSFERRTGFGIFRDFFGIFLDFLGYFQWKCTGFFRVIYPSKNIYSLSNSECQAMWNQSTQQSVGNAIQSKEEPYTLFL